MLQYYLDQKAVRIIDGNSNKLEISTSIFIKKIFSYSPLTLIPTK